MTSVLSASLLLRTPRACVTFWIYVCVCFFSVKKISVKPYFSWEVLFTFPPFSPFLPFVFHGLQSTVQPHSMEEAKLYQPYLRNIYGYVAKYVLRYR